MLYLIVGDDFKKAKECIKGLCASGVSPHEIDKEHFSEGRCQELVSSQGLFGQNSLVIFRGLLDDKEIETFIVKNCKEFAESPHIFVIWEEKLTKKVSDKIKKYTTTAWEYNEKTPYNNDFSIFTLADAVGRRDKKQAWILLHKAYSQKISPENIYGTLLWQIKAISLVQNAKEQGENTSSLGLKPFVVSKAIGFSQNYTKKEIQSFLSGLIDTYHRARGGEEDFEVGLERLILKL